MEHQRSLLGRWQGGRSSAALIAALRRTPSLKMQPHTDEAATRKGVRDGDQVGLLIIPKGFTAALGSSHPSARETYYAVEGNSDQHAAIAAIIALPGPFPLWMKIEQGVCGLLLIGVTVTVIVNSKCLRSLLASR